jgi:large subunit ribosomal protein L3
MKYIIARKLEMSQRFRPTGEVVPVTVVKVDPCVVTQVKDAARDGYVAVQVGSGTKKHLNKPEAGHRGASGSLAELREFRLDDAAGAAVGSQCDIASFQIGDIIEVTGISKGKGFQGVVKRHHFRGGPASHGHKDNLRMPGTIGAGGVQHVTKGRKMAGRMGSDQVTVKNLEIIEVVPEKNSLAIKGAVPGARGALLMISAPGEMKFIASPATEAAETKTE